MPLIGTYDEWSVPHRSRLGSRKPVQPQPAQLASLHGLAMVGGFAPASWVADARSCTAGLLEHQWHSACSKTYRSTATSIQLVDKQSAISGDRCDCAHEVAGDSLQKSGSLPMLKHVVTRTAHRSNGSNVQTSFYSEVNSLSIARDDTSGELALGVKEEGMAEPHKLLNQTRFAIPVESNTTPITSFDEPVCESSAKYLEALGKPNKERSVAELKLLQKWAAKIRYRDAEVQRIVDPSALSRAMKLQRTKPDEIIIHQGETGDAFFIIFSGAASVYVAYDQIESDPSRANKDRWPEAVVRSNGSRIQRMRRHGRGEFTPELPSRLIAKTVTRRHSTQSMSFLHKCDAATLSNPTSHQPSTPEMLNAERRVLERRRSLCHATKKAMATTRLTKPGPRIGGHAPSLEQHDQVGHKKASATDESGAQLEDRTGASLEHVFTYSENDSFGDLALLFGAARSASVVAEADTILVRVERADYDAVLRDAALEAVRQRAAFLKSLPVLCDLHFEHLVKIAGYMKREDHPRGASLLGTFGRGGSDRQRGKSDIVIIQSGEAEVESQVLPHMPPRRLLTLGPGTCMGTLMMDDRVSRALIPTLFVARTSCCTTLRLTLNEFMFRAGKRIVHSLATMEAGAWLSRLTSPGPLRALIDVKRFLEGPEQKAFLTTRHHGDRASRGLLSDSIRAARRDVIIRSASTPALRAHGTFADTSDTGSIDGLTAWLEEKREGFRALLEEGIAREESRKRQAERIKARLEQGNQRQLIRAIEELEERLARTSSSTETDTRASEVII